MSIFDNYLNPTFFLSPLRIANFANFAKNGEKVAVYDYHFCRSSLETITTWPNWQPL